jgi:hypothetical protein
LYYDGSDAEAGYSETFATQQEEDINEKELELTTQSNILDWIPT